MLIVKKYGGTSVQDRDRIFACAKRCVDEFNRGNQVVVVLSAMGQTTDELIEKAREINPTPSARELDMLLATGEQVTVSLFSMALSVLNTPSVSLNAFQVPMTATSRYGNARFKKVETERIRYELDEHKIVIITGFQAVNKYNNLVTLGRGGSDTTAVAIAAAMHADICEINTDVDGVYTADPRIVPKARKLDEITYDEMLDLSTLGAGVLHNRSVEMAKKYGIKLVVRSSFNDASGTLVKESVKVERTLISGVAVDKNADRISVNGMMNTIGTEFKLFRLLADAGINVDLIIQAVNNNDTKDVSFVVSGNDLDRTLALLREKKDFLQYQTLEYNTETPSSPLWAPA